MREIWKSVKDYEDIYEVSNLGRIRKIVKTYKNYFGYLYFCLNKDSKQSPKVVHRLVAEAFIPNPNNKPQINHKNGIKTDNKVENLEWATRKENMRHAHDNGLIHNKGIIKRH